MISDMAQTAAAKGGEGDSSKHLCSTWGKGIRSIVHTALYGPQLCLVVTFCCHKDKTARQNKNERKKTFTLFVIAEAAKKKKSVKNFISIFYVAFCGLHLSFYFCFLNCLWTGWKYEQIMSLENFTSSAAGHIQME